MRPHQHGPPGQPSAPHGHASMVAGSFPVRQSSLSSESATPQASSSLASTPRAGYATHAAGTESSSSLASTRRNVTPSQITQPRALQTESPLRLPPANMSPPTSFSTRDRSRQHSQGFFEPTMPTLAHRDPVAASSSNLTASQIAAQAAMHVQNAKHDRKRSQSSVEQFPMPPQSNPAPAQTTNRKPRNVAPIQTQHTTVPTPPTRTPPIPSLPNVGGTVKSAATTAASAAYPRSPLGSPFTPFAQDSRPTSPAQLDPGKPEKEKSSRRKLFSKPNMLHISKDKDSAKASAAKSVGIYGAASSASLNQSTTSLAEPSTPTTAIYSNPNASSSTLVPADRGFGERHKHHFLSRQKHKMKDDHAIALSSASSNSRPIDPNAPQSLYSFVPASPSVATKSISGLDLRHGGRALREKKIQEKAAQHANFAVQMPTASNSYFDPSNRNDPGEMTALFGPLTNTSQNSYSADLGIPTQGLSGFGLQNMGVDDAWPLLKARLLNIFEGEDLRTPIEDFNRLASVHLQRCIGRRTPSTLIEDVRDLFDTGFTSLDMMLRTVPDERLVVNLVETWTFVFGSILPFMQVVFLPFDLEFRGSGPLLGRHGEAAEFWSAALGNPRPGTANTDSTVNKQSSPRPALDIRTLVLHSFRSNVIAPRHDLLVAIFSRLSLDSMGMPALQGGLPTPPPLFGRPGTAASSGSGGHADPSSFNSQGSTLLDSSTAGSFGARSRATSNTSAGSFPSNPSRGRERADTNHSLTSAMPPPSAGMIMDPGRVTVTAARMLQCVSVLAALAPVGDDEESETTDRKKMERLAKELKLNWLGRSRMGRDRRGLVGTKVRGPAGFGIGVGA